MNDSGFWLLVFGIVLLMLVVEFFVMGFRIGKIRDILEAEALASWSWSERSCEHCCMPVPSEAVVCFRCGRDMAAQG